MNKLKPHSFIHRKPRRPPPQPITSADGTSSITAYNDEINRLTEHGAHNNVLLLYSGMLKTSNIPPDPFTYPNLLKACSSLHLLSHGLSVHQQIITYGLSNDKFIATSLINFYSRFGYEHFARSVFDLMPERNVVLWTAIIGCYCKLVNVDDAYCLYRTMQCDGIKPSSVTMLALLSGVFEVVHLQSLHACIVRYGFECDVALAKCFLNLYGEYGSVEDARNMFGMMCTRDIVSWNSLVSGYALAGNAREIVCLLHQMRVEGFEPDQQTLGSYLSAATARCANLKIGKLVLGQILTAGLKLDAQVGTLLVENHMKCGNVKEALQIFERISNKDVFLYTEMISGLVQNKCSVKAVTLFRMMLIMKVRPSSSTMASVISACATRRFFMLGTSIHGYMLRQRMDLDIPTLDSLVTMYKKCGYLEQSCSVLDMMKERDVTTWNAVVAGNAQSGGFLNALHFFNQIR